MAAPSGQAVRVVKSAAKDVSVKVIVRIRPMIGCEVEEQAATCIVSCDDKTLEIEREGQGFQFDACYDEDTTQTDLYQNEIKPIVAVALNGQNASCFAYGPTGAGIIPRVVKQLFRDIRQETGPWRFQVTVSYLEIYNEKVFDLLEFKDNDLPIREDQSRNIFIPGLIEVSKTEIVAPFRTLLGKIHLVDLAGSEDNRRTDNAGQRLKESGAINKSLFVLNQVVEALNRGDARIPYRDSKLTRLLQDSLGGDSHSCIVANISPCAVHFADSYNCLNFASKSRKIVNRATQRVVAPPAPPAPRAPAPPQRVKSTEPPVHPAKKEAVPPKTAAAGLSRTDSARAAKGEAEAAGTRASRDSGVDSARASSRASARASRGEDSDKSRPASQCEARRSSEGMQDTLAAMTPGSKTQYAKACVMKAKLLHKMGRLDDALALYVEAHELVPDSHKLEARINAMRAELSDSPAAVAPAAAPAAAGKGKEAGRERAVLAPINGDSSGNGTKRKASCDGPKRKKKRSSADPSWQPDTPPGNASRAATPAEPVAMELDGAADSADAHPGFNAELGAKVEQDLLAVLNTGGIKELMRINGVGKKRALNVIAFRENERPLGTLSDLHLCGFGKKLVDNLVKDNLMIKFR